MSDRWFITNMCSEEEIEKMIETIDKELEKEVTKKKVFVEYVVILARTKIMLKNLLSKCSNGKYQ